MCGLPSLLFVSQGIPAACTRLQSSVSLSLTCFDRSGIKTDKGTRSTGGGRRATVAVTCTSSMPALNARAMTTAACSASPAASEKSVGTKMRRIFASSMLISLCSHGRKHLLDHSMLVLQDLSRSHGIILVIAWGKGR